MTKSEIIAKVNELIATPNCNPELRAAAENYIKAQDKAAAEKLIKALESCVNSIDETLAFAESDMGKNIFGEETAKNIAQNCHKAKDAGEKVRRVSLEQLFTQTKKLYSNRVIKYLNCCIRHYYDDMQ